MSESQIVESILKLINIDASFYKDKREVFHVWFEDGVYFASVSDPNDDMDFLVYELDPNNNCWVYSFTAAQIEPPEESKVIYQK